MRKVILLLLLIVIQERAEALYNYQTEDLSIKLTGYYEFYGEYFYDRRDDRFKFSGFPYPYKIKESSSYEGRSAYMAITPPFDREPNHYIEFNVNARYKTNYFSYFKFHFNSSDDWNRYTKESIARLREGNFVYNKEMGKDFVNLKLFFRQKPEAFDDSLKIFQPGAQTSYLRNNPDPKRVFEWNGDECQGLDFKFIFKKHDIRLILIDGLSKWYYTYWPTFSTYYNDIWVAGIRYKYFLQENLVLGSSFLFRSWYNKASQKDWEDHWSIIAIDLTYLIISGIKLEGEYAKGIANYDEYSYNPLEKGEAYKIGIKIYDKKTKSRAEASFRKIGEKFPTDLALFYSDNVGYNFSFIIFPVKKFKIYFFYDFQHKNNKPDENKQEYRAEIMFNKIKELVDIEFKFQQILLHNERFIWWLQYTYENSKIYYGNINIYPLKQLKVSLNTKYWFYDQPHYQEYKPEREYQYGLSLQYRLNNTVFFLNYTFIKNFICFNLDEHLYNLEEYDELRKRRPKPEDTEEPAYGDSYGYYISDEDNIWLEGDNLKHHIFGGNVLIRIYKNAQIVIGFNWSKFDNYGGYWNRKLYLNFKTDF